MTMPLGSGGAQPQGNQPFRARREAWIPITRYEPAAASTAAASTNDALPSCSHAAFSIASDGIAAGVFTSAVFSARASLSTLCTSAGWCSISSPHWRAGANGALGQQPRRGEVQLSAYQELLGKIHDRLIERMDLRRLDVDSLGDEELRQKTQTTIQSIIDQADSAREIPDFVERSILLKDVLNEALGLGPLEELIADDAITEVMVNHAKRIYVERGGKLEQVDKTFSSDKAVLGVIERIVAPIGRRIDESSPMVDARLKDGSRVNAIIPPLALDGPCVTIRKFRRDMFGPDHLMNLGTFNRQIAEFLEVCVNARRSIVISGGTGSGKTTTLNILSSYIPTMNASSR